MVSPERVFVSTPPSVTVSPFATLAQACNLLGRVIRHCNDETPEPKFVIDEMSLLYGTVTSLLSLLPVNDVGGEFFNSVAICYR